MIRLRLVSEQAEVLERQRQGYTAKAEQYTRLAEAAQLPTVVANGQTLHAALDAFVEWYKNHHKTPESKPTYDAYIVGEQVKAVKKLAPNVSLSAFGLDEIEKLRATWKNGPMSSRGKPYSRTVCGNHVKVIRAFIKWLHKSPAFAWRKPEDYEDEAMRIRLTPEEKNNRVRTHGERTSELVESRS